MKQEWVFRFLVKASEEEMNALTDDFIKCVKRLGLHVNGLVKCPDEEIEVFE